MAKEQEANKEIVALSDFEHVLQRPTMYIGSVEKTEEVVQIIENKHLIEKKKIISIGFYKMLNEIIDNAFDEAKRMRGTMTKIKVEVDSKTNRVTVTDFGGGFINAEKSNPKTDLSNVETAMSLLRAGSNFNNNTATDSLIGTNGVGAALVNMLSEEFKIITVNKEVHFAMEWKRFLKSAEVCNPHKRGEKTGTVVTYIPRKDVFKDCKWDKEYLHTTAIFRQFLKKKDPVINNLELEYVFDGEILDLDIPFIPDDALAFENKSGMFFVWEKYEYGASAAFVNGAICTGVHEKIFVDWINEIFEYPLSHHFYEYFLILNLPPKLVRFADQNKTKYAAGKWELQPILEKEFYKRLRHIIMRSSFYDAVKKKIDERTLKQDMNAIKYKKKQASRKISDKYFPPSGSKGTLFIVEGSSAMGSILQKRDPRVDAVYSLKGKIKNARSLGDLSQNNEIIDLMNILNLEPKDGGKCAFSNIAIAADCLDEETIIHTKDGYKQISNITIEDSVLSHDLKYHKVINVVKTEKEEYLEFIFGQEIIKCSLNHIWRIVRNGKICDVMAKDILSTDFFIKYVS